jgi:hypothetical protein
MYIASALTIFGAVWFYRSQRRPERVLVAVPPREPETAGTGAAAEGAAGEGAAAEGVAGEGAAAKAEAGGAGAAEAGPRGHTPVPDDPAPAGSSESRESQDSEQTRS